MPYQTDYRNGNRCQPRASNDTGAKDESLRSKVKKPNDICHHTHVIPTRLRQVIRSKQPRRTDRNIPRRKSPCTQVGDWRWCDCSNLVSSRWSVNSLKIGGVFVALRGVDHGCYSDLFGGQMIRFVYMVRMGFRYGVRTSRTNRGR